MLWAEREKENAPFWFNPKLFGPKRELCILVLVQRLICFAML